jgi:RNA 3'-terminal phosphate cyclase (ATP)
VRWSPTFDYLSLQWLPALQSLGFRGRISLEKAGYYPKGGGVIEGVIEGAKKAGEYRKLFRGALKKISVHVGSSNLPSHVSTRMASRIRARLKEFSSILTVEDRTLPSPGTNAVIALSAVYEHCHACFTDLGERGKPAEEVAGKAAADFFTYNGRKGALDPHMADQVLLPLCLAGDGESVFTTTEVTNHLLTNAAIIRRFLPLEIEIQGGQGEDGRVTVRGKKGFEGSVSEG